MFQHLLYYSAVGRDVNLSPLFFVNGSLLILSGRCSDNCLSSCPLPPAHFKNGFASVLIALFVFKRGQKESAPPPFSNSRQRQSTTEAHTERRKGRGTPIRNRRIHIPRAPLYKMFGGLFMSEVSSNLDTAI